MSMPNKMRAFHFIQIPNNWLSNHFYPCSPSVDRIIWKSTLAMVKMNLISHRPSNVHNYTNCVCFGSDLFEYLNFMVIRIKKERGKNRKTHTYTERERERGKSKCGFGFNRVFFHDFTMNVLGHWFFFLLLLLLRTKPCSM